MSQQHESELEAAVAEATKSPASAGAWERVESAASALDRPDQAAAAYRTALEGKLAAEVAVEVGKRAARFHEEWFGDDPGGLADVLTRVLELSPKSEWAFQKLTVVLTMAERWDDVLALYDRSIASARGKGRKAKLLDEAYQVAKDLADQPDRAIDYLKAKLALEPDEKQEHALERLLEKHARWHDLIALWRDRLSSQEGAEQAATLERIARCWFEDVGDAAQALDTARDLLDRFGAERDAEVCALLERIATAESTPAGTRDEALLVLRHRYESTARPREIVRVLEAVLPLGDDDARRSHHHELGQRLADLGDHAAALDHYAALLALDPGSVTTQRALRDQARQADRFDRYAAVLAEVAETCPDASRKVALLADAAATRLANCDDPDAAISLLQGALEVEGIAGPDVLTVGRRLEDLLAGAERHAERLGVLERLADAETVESSRRALIGDVALLAEDLGEVDRALRAWGRRLEDDPGDMRALDSMIQLLDREQRWDELIDALSRRVASDVPATQKRADLVRIAAVLETELSRKEQALDAWLRVKEEYGDDPEVIAALTRLMTELERWEDLTALLEATNQRHIDYLTNQLASLGDAYRQAVGDNPRALECYRRALTVDPRHEAARAGLVELAGRDATRNDASEALVHSYRSTGDLVGLLELVEPRLAATGDVRRHREVLREAADIAEEIARDPDRALGYLVRLFPLTPRDRVLEDRTVALARGRDRWSEVFHAYAGAAQALDGDVHAVAELALREAALRESEASDRDGALSAYGKVVSLLPGSTAAVTAVARLAGAAGRWDEVAAAVLGYVRDRDHLPEGALADALGAAEDADAVAALAGALERGLEGAELGARHAAELYWRVAGWQQGKVGDEEAAERALLCATELDKSRADTHRALAELQRKSPGAALWGTLRRLCAIDSDDLDVFAEAAEVADEHLGDDEAQQSLSALLSRASAAWKGTAPARGERNPEELVAKAVDRLVERAVAAGNGARALDLLLEASRLPFDDLTRLALRRRAADIADEVLGDPDAAIEMYRSVLSTAPTYVDAIEKLAVLYRQRGRLPELLALRRHELDLEVPAERRTELRLEIAALLDEIETHYARMELLRANLEDEPGHRASVDAVADFLGRLGRHAELADLLSAQARAVESSDAARAAELWAQVAELAETRLTDVPRALEAHRKVANLAPTLHALDSLARLYIERGQHGAAVPWLEQAIDEVEESDRPALVARLAQAHLAADHPDDAVSVLDAEIERGGAVLELRAMLADLHREAQNWQGLADVLTASLPHRSGDEAVAAAREAAELYHGRLGAPAAAIPALRAALEAAPDDRALRAMLAKSLRAAGQLDDARALLESLIAEFGRRRSKERAAIHAELAGVAQAQGRLDDAIAELELASKMDVGNAHILKTLAELARDQGNLDSAERSLRALLLQVRRDPPGDDAEAVGPSEVLYELHHIAAIRDDEDKAAELLESVREAAAQSDAETLRLRRTLLAHGEHELLRELLAARAEQADDAAAKASLTCHVADLLETHFDDPSAALDQRLAALELTPGDDALHDRARVLSGQLGRVGDYLERLERIVGELRREEDAQSAAELLVRAAQVAETDLDDLGRARDLLLQAEQLADRPAAALSALSRVCGALGDTAEQTRALDRLASMAGTDDGPASARADALYQLAELQSGTADLVPRCLETLDEALEVEPRYRQAGTILRRAADASGDAAEVLAAYEQVARAGNDKPILLDFLERRARGAEATPAQVKEAVDLARDLGESERGARLLATAVDAARGTAEGLSGAVWAAVDLSALRAEEGRFDEARDLLLEIAESAPDDQVRGLGLEVAGKAAGAGELALAAEVYELLRRRDPRAADIWEPLFDVYRQLGDDERLGELVQSTLPSLVDPGERNRLRLAMARHAIDAGRGTDAVEVLRDAILDDPESAEATGLLEDVLRQAGDREGLADFLWQRFEEARSRESAAVIVDVAQRLGALLDELESPDTAGMYRQALEVAPESPELLAAVLAHLPGDADLVERADLLERLVRVSPADEAPARAAELSALRQEAGDDAGVQRALELGLAAAPDDRELRARLESWYQSSGQWQRLAEMMVTEAGGIDDDRAAAARLREAAILYRDSLSDLATAAAVLEKARERAPADPALVSELASCQAASGSYDTAVDSLTGALERIEGAARLDLLLLRSDLLAGLGRGAEAIADLEEAHTFGRSDVEPLLVAGLEREREAAASRGDGDVERQATLRLVELARDRGDDEAARSLLRVWIERAPTDREALVALRDMDRAAGRWDGVIAACARLIGVEDGPAQVDAGLQLAEAARNAGTPVAAVPGLERVHADQPGEARVRDILRELYEESGAYRELASVLLADADHADDDDERYEKLRLAADLLVNYVGDPAAAIGPAQKAKELRPDDHATLVLLADILIASGDLVDATAMLEPAIAGHKRRSPELAALQYRMAKIAAAGEDKEGQLTWLKKAFDVDRKDGVIASELAHLATELGDYDLALKPLRAITLMDSPGPVNRVMALLWEAKIEHARGNRAKAELWAKKALREDPSYAEAEEFLATIAE